MSDADDDQYDDDIDWEEAIIAADAADSARKPEKAAGIEEQHNDRDADTQVAVAELLLLYDLLEREEASISGVGDIEDTLAMAAAQAAKFTGKSLFDQFRKKRGFLSVTDLTAPGGWCEVQYAYSLLGRRELKPEQRPDRIVTAAGNEIKIDKKIQVAHEKMLEKGRQVHKVLEREVHPEQVYIKTHTKADAWGLRIFNQIVSLATLKDAGKAREIPVFGFIEDIFVMGVMDEIERRPLPNQNEVSEETPQVNKISNYFSPTKQASKKRTEGLYLVDSKTRRVNSMPRPSHTVASKTQLMLYKYFFDAHARQTFDWPRFYSHIDISADEPFSPAFIEQTTAMGLDPNSTSTLGDLARQLQAMHADMGALEDGLELVYRWRSASSPSSSQTKPKGKRKSRNKAFVTEDADLQKAIAASLADQSEEKYEATTVNHIISSEESQGEARASGTRDSPEVLSSDSEMSEPGKAAKTDISSSAPPTSQPLDTAAIAARAEEVTEVRVGSIIGTEKFLYNQDKLSTYVKDAIGFWTGRPPRGVSIDEVNKCRTCEFQGGCEWLQQKADEHRASVAARKAR